MIDPGIHSLTIRGDREVGLSYLPEAEKALRLLHGRMAISGLQTCAQFHKLSDTDYCYVRVAGDLNLIGIFVETQDQKTPPLPVYVETVAPDILSGVIANTFVFSKADDGTKLVDEYYPELNTQQLFKLRAGSQANARLAILPHSSAASTAKSQNTPTQCGIKPTMYSGSMKGVIQVLFGLGFVPPETLYTSSYLVSAEKKKKKVSTPFEQDVLRDGYQIRYDYTWNRTHGITIGPDGSYWLIEISSAKGVIAMPLPLHPLSKSDEYKNAATELGDVAVLHCLNTYGGVPTGESFQSGATLEAQIRAGQVFRLATPDQLRIFYDGGSPFSSACGWAFSQSGKEAHNTAIFEGGYYQQVRHVSASISVGTMQKENPSGEWRVIAKALAQFRQKYNFYRFEAAIFKLKGMTDEEINAQRRLLAIKKPDEYMTFLDEMVIQPPSGFSSNIGLSGEGPLWGNSNIEDQQIKMWEPLWPEGERCIISHTFTFPSPAVDCDTTVFVYFQGDTLKVVKYFMTTKQTAESQRLQIPPPEAAWYFDHTGLYGVDETNIKGNSISSGCYTSDFDDREEYPENTSGTRTYMVTHGYSPAIFTRFAGDFLWGYMSRFKFNWWYTVESSWSNAGRISAVVCMPAYMREACFYAHKEHKSAFRVKTEWRNQPVGMASFESISVKKPILGEDKQARYYGFRAGSSLTPDPNWDFTYKPQPSGFVNSYDIDDVMPGGDSVDTGIPGFSGLTFVPFNDGITASDIPPLPGNTNIYTPFSAAFKVGFGWYGGSKIIRQETYGGEGTSASDAAWWNMWHKWFEPSPGVMTPFGIKGYLMTQWATGNSAGQSDALCYQVEPDGNIAVEEATGDHYSDIPCFIGVVS